MRHRRVPGHQLRRTGAPGIVRRSRCGAGPDAARLSRQAFAERLGTPHDPHPFRIALPARPRRLRRRRHRRQIDDQTRRGRGPAGLGERFDDHPRRRGQRRHRCRQQRSRRWHEERCRQARRGGCRRRGRAGKRRRQQPRGGRHAGREKGDYGRFRCKKERIAPNAIRDSCASAATGASADRPSPDRCTPEHWRRRADRRAAGRADA